MSYDIYLKDPITGDILELEHAHQIKGGTYAISGTTEASLNITYNYAPLFCEHIDKEKGIRFIYGMTGADSLPILKVAAEKLGNDKSDNYWELTEGNVKAALLGLIALASMRPDGVWEGD